jgi:hypothetical protein
VPYKKGLGEMGGAGLEPPPLALSKTPISEHSGAKSGAPVAPDTPKTTPVGCSALIQDTGLALVVERWPKLPDAIRKKILLLGQGKPCEENVKLTWTKKGYEKTTVDDKFEKR